MSDDEKKRRTAYHEAGHAVAAYILGRRFKYVTVIPEEDSLGHIAHHSLSVTAMEDIQVGSFEEARSRRRIENLMMSHLAGEAAVEIMLGDPQSEGCDEDWRQSRDLADKALAPDEVEHFLSWLRVRIRMKLQTDQPKAAIQALADALLQQGKIGYKEACAIIKQAMDDCYQEWSRKHEDAAA